MNNLSAKFNFFRPDCWVAIFLAAFLLSTGSGCQEPMGTSIENGCRDNYDCPLPERQKCIIELGVCVGHTSELGSTDGSIEESDEQTQADY
ncbi:MAG: hypothetical protein PF689_00310 [Deltaproteobacteria bacterium]|nr:hypothetical protein [Deltaproteobacteria bacterium]